MKQRFSLALVLTLVLTACGPAAQTTPTPPPPVEVTVEVTVTPAPEPTPEPAPTAAPEPTLDNALPDALPLEFWFSSGAGGWGTELALRQGGSFQGNFHDSDLGSSGEGYDATVYICLFRGRFADVKRLDGDTWSLTLAELEAEGTQGEERIEEETYDGTTTVRVRYVTSYPYGLDGGKDFILYGPDTPVEGLDEEFLSWWPGRWEEDKPATLNCYGLWNRDAGYGFFAYPEAVG